MNYHKNMLKLTNDFELMDGAKRTNHFQIYRSTEAFYFQMTVTNGRSRETGELRRCMYRLTDAEARELHNFLATYLNG